MKRLLKWLFIAFWAMIIGIPLALDLWHYWDRWLALVGLVVVFWGGAYVLMRWDERREESEGHYVARGLQMQNSRAKGDEQTLPEPDDDRIKGAKTKGK